ncbi:MAG TPA: hypothetical protein VGL53_11850 [Bryobacteraceae bacterium]|jgi:hypothetical protein
MSLEALAAMQQCSLQVEKELTENHRTHCRQYARLLAVSNATVRQGSICKTTTLSGTTSQLVNQIFVVRRDGSTDAVSTTEKLDLFCQRGDAPPSLDEGRELSKNARAAMSQYSLPQQEKERLLPEDFNELTEHHRTHCREYAHLLTASGATVGQRSSRRTTTSSGTTCQQVSQIFIDKNVWALNERRRVNGVRRIEELPPDSVRKVNYARLEGSL